MAIIYTVCRLN